MEPFYPLRALVCAKCFLVQLEEFETPEQIFSADYAYFSSYSSSWLEHSRRYAEQMIERLSLDGEQPGRRDRLQRRLPAAVLPRPRDPGARHRAGRPTSPRSRCEKGIPTVVEFFGEQAARSLAEESSADLLLGNNVLAHVPDLNDFVAGMKILLKPDGVITMEFPHLMRLIEENQWDTIYHEHFSYFSFLTVSARLRGPRAAPVRCRGAAHARRLAAHLRRPRGGPATSPKRMPRASCASASGPPATSSSTPTSATDGVSSRTSARSSAS